MKADEVKNRRRGKAHLCLAWAERDTCSSLRPSHANTTTRTTARDVNLAQEPPLGPQFDPCWLVIRTSTFN